MRETERYLNRATRGLWGAARRDARRELRGAVEDRTYRHQVLGLSETDAARAALLASVAAVLGVQALAQVPTVRAIPEQQMEECRPLSPAARQNLTAQQRQTYDAFVKSKGGLEGAVA